MIEKLKKEIKDVKRGIVDLSKDNPIPTKNEDYYKGYLSALSYVEGYIAYLEEKENKDE